MHQNSSERSCSGLKTTEIRYASKLFVGLCFLSFANVELSAQVKVQLPEEAVSSWTKAEKLFLDAGGSWFVQVTMEGPDNQSELQQHHNLWVKKRNNLIALESQLPQSPTKKCYVNGDGISFCAKETEPDGAWLLITAQTASFDGVMGYDPWLDTIALMGRGFAYGGKRLDRFLQDARIWEISDSSDHPDQKIIRYEAESRVGPQQVRKVTKGSFFVEPRNQWRLVKHEAAATIEGLGPRGMAKTTYEFDERGFVSNSRSVTYADETCSKLLYTMTVSVERLGGVPSASEFTLQHYGIEATRSRGFWSRPAIWLAAIGVIAIALAIVVRRKRQFST